MLAPCMQLPFGNDKEYEQMFAKPAQARENVKNTVLIYSDEVTVWIKVSSDTKQWYLASEKVTKQKLRTADQQAQTEICGQF